MRRRAGFQAQAICATTFDKISTHPLRVERRFRSKLAGSLGAMKAKQIPACLYPSGRNQLMIASWGNSHQHHEWKNGDHVNPALV